MTFGNDDFNELFELIKKVFKLIDDENFVELLKYETDNLVMKQLVEIDSYKKQGKKLNYDKVLCYPLDGSNISYSEDSGIYTTSLKVSYEMYITNGDGEVVEGAKDYITESVYTISFVENNFNDQENGICDHCCAPIDKNSCRCEYCGSIKIARISKWIICDITDQASDSVEKRVLNEKRQSNSKEWEKLLKSLEEGRNRS